MRWRPEPTLLTEELLEPVEAYDRMMGRMNYEVSDARLEETIQETPPRFRILDVAGGLVLGVLRDEMDVENVVVYGLVR